MAALDAKKTRANLLKKGFSEAPGDHHYFEFWHDGKFITKTKSSRNSEPIYDELISAMANQCKMKTSFFKDFAKCTKSQDQYIELLKSNGHII